MQRICGTLSVKLKKDGFQKQRQSNWQESFMNEAFWKSKACCILCWSGMGLIGRGFGLARG